MDDACYTLSSLEGLRRAGVRVAIDDFGVGYSSLAYLKRLPVDEVKIDRSFINELAVDSSNAAIVESVISLGHAFGLSVTAEGVEDFSTLASLEKLGCDEVQGYYLGFPMEPQALLNWAIQREIARNQSATLSRAA